jgi:predicted PurR-regulated permease PerM
VAADATGAASAALTRWLPLVPAPWSLPVLATLALVAWLWAGAAFLIPILAAIVLAVLLWPPMLKLQRVLRARWLAALTVVVAAGALSGGLAYAVVTQCALVSDQLPTVLRQLARDVAQLGTDHARAVQRTRNALNELDRSVAKVTGTEPVPANASQRHSASIVASVTEWGGRLLIDASKSIAAVLLQCGAMALLCFFLLCGGEALQAKLEAWCRRGSATPERCLPELRECTRQVRLFAVVTSVTNAVFGACVAVVFSLFGVPEAAMWGVAAGALHFLPYAGLAIVAVIGAVEVYVLQASVLQAVLAAGSIAALGVIVGTVMAMWLQGRAARVDGALVFAGTVFWSVIWGAWGLLLGPLLVVLTRQVFLVSRTLAAAPRTPEAEPPARALPAPADALA